MAKLLGIIGALVVCAGIDLLWQSRRESRYWLSAYGHALRAMFRQRGAPRVFPKKRHAAVRVLLGMSFAFLLGPILLVVAITLMLFPQ
ncbi:MAG TPA: hypothetical protein VNE63_06275 [Candidatus Acidoferrales bacterium]|nr:hypothetical protein [Candidatus Acidoferrales bacterium]